MKTLDKQKEQSLEQNIVEHYLIDEKIYFKLETSYESKNKI